MSNKNKNEKVTSHNNNNQKKYFYSFVKRLFDIIVSLIGIVLLVPITLILKIAFMLTGDFHSIFYTQERIGKYGKNFKFFKYRSMMIGADEYLNKLLKSDKELAKEYKENKKLKNDPRITKVGKVIRKFSIDELPQLLNIFIGNMSLIGNRPYLPKEKKDMGEYFEDIVKTKPGITGYWQVNGRSDISFKKRLELEKYYSNHCSLLLDIKIFFKTFKVVLFGKGAK